MSTVFALPVTSLYAGILSIAFALTSLRVGLTRAGTGKMYGADAGSKMEHLSRSAGTIGEYSFPFLLLLGLIEYQAIISTGLLWWFGLAFTAFRIGHSLQLVAPKTVPFAIRPVSFLATIASFVLASVILIFGSAKA